MHIVRIVPAVLLAFALAACGSSVNFSTDPSSYAKARPASGLAAVQPNSAGSDAAKAFGARFSGQSIAASSVKTGAWGSAASATEPIVLYAVVSGGSDVQDRVRAAFVPEQGENLSQNYKIETTTQQVQDTGVEVVTTRSPSSQTVVAVATPAPDLMVLVSSPEGDSDSVNAAMNALLSSGRSS